MESEKIVLSFKAGADLSTSERRAVRYSPNAAGEVILTGAATEQGIGVIDDGGGNTSGRAVSVVTYGRCKAKVGGAIGIHTRVSGAASGKLAAAASTHFVLGVTEQASGADNDDVTLFVRPSAVPLA
jgi:hypothetical protein